MRNIFLYPLLLLIFVCTSSCNKAPERANSSTEDIATIEKHVLADFTNNIALHVYLQLNNDALNLNAALDSLNNNLTDSNLQVARLKWKALRETWEQSESFLFGPVEDNDFDPNMDTWPTDYTQLDSLLLSNASLQLSDVQGLTLSLRGFHPIEYIIFGNHGDKKAADISLRQRQYMLSLSRDICKTCNMLYQCWAAAPVNFAQELTTAGVGSKKYNTKQEAFMALVGAMVAICEEVGDGKMKEPFLKQAPNLVESPYSGNSLTDFRNNIIGVRNIYMGVNGGYGLKDLVASVNKNLDNTIQQQITIAINSFNNISGYFEDAIIDEPVQVQQTMLTLNNLHETLETQLIPFIQLYIKD